MVDKNDDESEKWCVVCSDSVFGYYYGVNICEGCKSFFKRIVQKELLDKYECIVDESCFVDKQLWVKCQFCWFQKCFIVGMVVEGIDFFYRDFYLKFKDYQR